MYKLENGKRIQITMPHNSNEKDVMKKDVMKKDDKKDDKKKEWYKKYWWIFPLAVFLLAIVCFLLYKKYKQSP